VGCTVERTLVLVAIAAFPNASFAEPRDTIDVTVEGEPLLPRATDAAVASSTVTGDALAAPGAAVVDAISSIPSVRIARTGSSADLTTIGLRGASSAETPVYLAGIRWNDQATGAADLSTIPLFFLKRIDVYRGNGPVELGEMGLGGALVLTPEPPNRSELRAGAGFGSFGEVSGFAAATGGDDAARVGIAARVDKADNDFTYTDDRGTRFDPSDDVERRRRNADATTSDLFTVARMRLGERGGVNVVLNTLRREQGLVGLGVIPAMHARAMTESSLFSVDSFARCAEDPASDRCRIEASAFGRFTSYLASDPERELPFGTTSLATHGALGGFRVAAAGDPATPLHLRVGAEETAETLNLAPFGDRETSARRSASRAFGTARYEPLGVLAFDVAASIASIRTEGPDSSPIYASPEVRGGVRARPIPELDFYANGNRYVRTPTLGESFGISDSVLGNPQLIPERGEGVEGGARFEKHFKSTLGLALEGVFFARWASDLITYERSSFGALRPYNVGSARILGGELTGATVIARVLRIDGSLTITDGRDTSAAATPTADRLPLLATYVGAAGIHADFDEPFRSPTVERISLGSTFVARTPRPLDSTGTVLLPNQLVWDADVAVALAGGELIVRGRMSNLLDDKTTDLLGYPIPGRAGHLTLETVLR